MTGTETVFFLLWRNAQEQSVRTQSMKTGDYLFNRNDPRRGTPFGAAGVHRKGGACESQAP